MRYTYGTSETAAQRLEEIAKFFNPLAKQFIQGNLKRPVEVAIDLGCGPGFTTEMLALATNCKNVYGLDSSTDYIAMAKDRFGQLHFVKHDVTQVPFPLLADVMYMRFLLSHLNDIGLLLTNWVNELSEDGVLFVEELEDIYTDVDVFKRYLEVNAGLVSSQGAELFVGRTLVDAVSGLSVISNESVILPVKDWQAATWFYPNTISVWEQEQYVLDLLLEAERKEISEALLDVKMDKSGESNIAWKMRRIILSKVS